MYKIITTKHGNAKKTTQLVTIKTVGSEGQMEISRVILRLDYLFSGGLGGSSSGGGGFGGGC